MLSSLMSFLLTIVGSASLLCGLLVFMLWIVSFLCLSVKVNKTEMNASERQVYCRDVFVTRSGEVKANMIRAGWTLLVVVLVSVLLWLSVEEEEMDIYLHVVKNFSVWIAITYAIFILGCAMTSVSAPQLVQKHGTLSDLDSCKKNFTIARRILAALLVLCVAAFWIMCL